MAFIMGTQEHSPASIQDAYDVFLNFRGKGTGKGFTDHLYAALVRADFHTFRDDDNIESGEEIESRKKRAIKESRIAIIVFSKTYASSRWCLDTLVEILHRQKTSGLQVVPIFYDVDPSQVRWQSKSFAKAFARHEEMSKKETDEIKQEWMERTKRWREALKEATELSGMVLRNEADGHEAKFVEKIVKVIGDKLNCRVLSVAPILTGISSRGKNINLWLQDESTNVSVIAICGTGGIGKTTIAKFVYNQHYKKFDVSSFLANIKERSEEPEGLVSLQKQLLSDIGREENISCLNTGIIKIQDAICRKRTLLVLDDADQIDQLNAVCGMQNRFALGSKIIVTTRNERLLKPHEAYKVHLMASTGTRESSSSMTSRAYDVFLSFRGKDTRKGFTDHLYIALVKAGFHTFRDDDKIERGQKIESELKRAIEQSRISIIVFSKTYASSRWCLDELVEILDRQKTSGLYVLPVFYDVDPSQLMLQKGSFAKAFARHEERSEKETNEKKLELMERLKRLRAAIEEVAGLEVMVLQNETDRNEAEFIKKIVKVVGDKLKCRVLNVAPDNACKLHSMAFMGTQNSSSSMIQCAYDVFLSFRGEDTGKGFTDHLYTALVDAGFHTFRDDDEIERGEMIMSELERAIERSKISIIVFSKTYASSRWCLDKLVKILHARRASQLLVLPVFYGVHPSQVRWQSGNFAEAFARHEERSMERVESWRAALKEVSGLTGIVLQNEVDGDAAKCIKKIVEVIGDKLNRRLLSVVPHLIGINSRVENINLWLQDESTYENILAICGMGGIGKTTIAKFVYNLLHSKFEASSFLGSIRELSKQPNGLITLQKQLLSDIGRKENISSEDEGICKIRDAIYNKRVLLVFDDVDHVDQLNAVFGLRNWFNPGSKIIVTTRNERLLQRHGGCKVEKVEPFDFKNSLELFSWHAFEQDHPIEGYLELSERVVHYCGGLPLALEILGSFLCGKSVELWDSALQKLEAIPDDQILRKLRISFDSLEDDHDKELFLDIACFFVGRDRDLTIKILQQCGFYATIGILNLIDRSLLTVDMNNQLSMHQLLQDMGREIVRLESPKELGKHSRLWYHKDSFNVLREKIGTETIEGLLLDMHMFTKDKSTTVCFNSNNSRKRNYHEFLEMSEEVNLVKRHHLGLFYQHQAETTTRNSRVKLLETNAFTKMRKLRLLQLNYVELSGGFERFPKTLRWLCWHGFSLQSIPFDFPMENLVVLEMHHSSLKQVWKGTQFAYRLQVLDLSHSQELIRTPDFSGLPNLETLILEGCVNLVGIHESIGKLERLILLNVKNCKNLRKLPRSISMLQCLEILIMSGCSSLNEFPTELRTMNSLKKLYADGIATNEEVQPWHASIWSWVSRPKSNEVLSISLPSSLVYLSLEECNLTDDVFLVDFSNLFQLQYLNLSGTLICGLPESITGLTALQTLCLHSCKRLKSLMGVPNVRQLQVYSCPSLEKILYLPTSSSQFELMSRPFGLHRSCNKKELDVISCPSLEKIEISNVGQLTCKFYENLVEVEGSFKLEPTEIVDEDMLRTWGFFNYESIINFKINYYNGWTRSQSKKLPLERLYERGVYSYFLPGNKVPYGFSMKSTRSPLSFFVPSVYHFRPQGLILCSVYTSSPNQVFCSSHIEALCTRIENRTKQDKWTHCPMVMDLPSVNEDMIWLSHWNFGTLLADGDMVEVSVAASPFELKEFAIELVYTQANCEATTQETFLYQDIITGEVSKRR